MNVASHSLNENEYEYYKNGKNEIYVQNENMGNYHDEINVSKLKEHSKTHKMCMIHNYK